VGRANRRRRTPLVARVPGPRRIGQWVLRTARRSLPILAVLAVTLAAGAAGTWARIWVATSPRFAVTEINIKGNRALEVGQVRASMGLRGGENIFALDLVELELRLEAHPWIREAHVERRLPDRLLVEITEQQAAGLVELGGLYLIDETGAPFKRAAIEQGEGDSLIVITGITREEYALSPHSAQRRFREAIAIAARYHENQQRPIVGEIHLDPRRGTTLFSRDNATEIRIGSGNSDELGARFLAFDAAWAALTDDERDSAVVIHANRDTIPQRVSVAFSEIR
jgi:cell division protein FtsQ